MLKEFRDSWEVWRRKVSGGTGEVTADAVDYDNTQTGLQSTNVQGAIDEVVTKISDIKVKDAYVQGTTLFITTSNV